MMTTATHSITVTDTTIICVDVGPPLLLELSGVDVGPPLLMGLSEVLGLV